MQKVQGIIFAFLYFNFFSFIVPLRYFLYSAILKISISYTFMVGECFIYYIISNLVLVNLWARISSRYSWCMKSSRCKLGALV